MNAEGGAVGFKTGGFEEIMNYECRMQKGKKCRNARGSCHLERM